MRKHSHRLTTGSTQQWAAARLLYPQGSTRTTHTRVARHRIVHRDLWDSAGDYSDLT